MKGVGLLILQPGGGVINTTIQTEAHTSLHSATRGHTHC